MVSRSTSTVDRAIGVGRVEATVRLPGSKSITQRFLGLACLREGPVRLRRPLRSDDIRHFCEGLRVLGRRVEIRDGDLEIEPGSPPTTGELWCGAGGTMLRLMTGILAAKPGRWRLDGVARLRERPLRPLIRSLRDLGVEIRCPEEEGHAPLEIDGGLRGGRTRLDASESSQYLSALLLAGLAADRAVEIDVVGLTSRPYVDLTVDAIESFGGVVTRRDDLWRVVPGLDDTGELERTVEGDWSAAAYPAAAAALTGGRVVLEGVEAGSRQGDRAFLDLLVAMGAEVSPDPGGVRVVGPGQLRAIDVSMADVPDQVPTLAALAPFCRGTTRIRDVAHLRLKESDRLRAMTRELRRLGAEVEELSDGLRIPGVWSDPTAVPADEVIVDTWDDHRIAMSLAVLGLRRPGVRLREPDVVRKSWPGFWDSFDRWRSPIRDDR